MRTILVAIDFSRVTGRLLSEAALLARALDARVILVHVVPDDPDFRALEGAGPEHRDGLAEHLHEVHAELQDLAEGLRSRGLVAGARLIRGVPLEKLVELTRAADVVRAVVGSHGKGEVTRRLVGSASEALVREAGCPVLVVPSRLEG